jgi:hypothetical protein
MTEYTTHTDGQRTSSVDSTVRDRQQQHAGSHSPADRRDANSPVDRRDADSPAGSQTEVV